MTVHVTIFVDINILERQIHLIAVGRETRLEPISAANIQHAATFHIVVLQDIIARKMEACVPQQHHIKL